MTNQNSRVLDLGCGPNCLVGATGMDIRPYPGVSVVHNINQGPWPLPDNSFDRVRIQHVIEHVANLQLLVTELHRVSADGAVLEFVTPHYSSHNSWGDPTHLWHFALPSIPLLWQQNLPESSFTVLENRLRFSGSLPDLAGWLLYRLSARSYEKHFAWIFPAYTVETKIRIHK